MGRGCLLLLARPWLHTMLRRALASAFTVCSARARGGGGGVNMYYTYLLRYLFAQSRGKTPADDSSCAAQQRRATCFCCWVHAARPAGGRAARECRARLGRAHADQHDVPRRLRLRAAAPRVRADGAGEGRARAGAEPRVARAPRRRRGRGLGRVAARGGRRRGGRGGEPRPAGRALARRGRALPV